MSMWTRQSLSRARAGDEDTSGPPVAEGGEIKVEKVIIEENSKRSDEEDLELTL